jgi:tetratricopeptide (TPR) repeat protein
MTRARKKTSQIISQARKDLEESRASEDQFKICMSLTNLGSALFQANEFKEGTKSFREADKISKELGDYTLQVKCWGIQVFAYQISAQLPNAFEISQKIQTLAEAEEDLGVLADALATQGQILIESGDEIGSLEKFNSALSIAEEIEDKPRQMKILGAFGHYSLTIASGDQAESYFKQARDLACELGDRQSEIGFHGNLGALLKWKGDFQKAGKIFKEVLVYMREIGDQEAEIRALLHLIQVYEKLNDDNQCVKFAKEGLAVAKETNLDPFVFSENLISALYRLEKVDEAHQATTDAIEMARAEKNREKEVNFLLSLGESYMVTEQLEEALETYQQALDGAQRLQRQVDRAYLSGRIGVILAELERFDQAINYHQEAIRLAREHNQPELEGEQLSLLAMAYMDNGELDTALDHADQSLQKYLDADLQVEADKVRKLISQIKDMNDV